MTIAAPVQVIEGDQITGSNGKTQPDRNIATHTHIKGLGLNPDGTPIPIAAGFVGQLDAREVQHYIHKNHPFLTTISIISNFLWV